MENKLAVCCFLQKNGEGGSPSSLPSNSYLSIPPEFSWNNKAPLFSYLAGKLSVVVQSRTNMAHDLRNILIRGRHDYRDIRVRNVVLLLPSHAGVMSP